MFGIGRLLKALVPPPPQFGFLGLLAAAVPAIVGGIAKHKAAKKQADFSDKMYRDAKADIDADRADQLAWLEQMTPQFQSLAGMAMGPQITNTTSSYNDMLRKVVDPGQARMKAALDKQYFQDITAPALEPGYAARQIAAINAANAGAEQAERNALIRRGGSMDMPLASTRATTAEKLNFMAGLPMLKEQIKDKRRATAANWMGQWQGQHKKGTSSQTTEGPANVGAALSALGAMRPPERQILYRG